MRHFDASIQVRIALCILIGAISCACGGESDHPPVVGAPRGPVISEGGAEMVPGNGGESNVGGNTASNGGTANTVGLGNAGANTIAGAFGTADSSNGGSNVAAGIAGAAFGVGGSSSSSAGGMSF